MAVAPNNKMRVRMMVMMLCFTIGGSAALIYQLFHIQLVRGEEYQRKAIDQQMASLTINADRGEIRDSSGKTLAVSASVWDVIVNPKNIKSDPDPETGLYEVDVIADGLSEILGEDRTVIRDKCLKKNTQYVVLARRVEKPIQEKINTFLGAENNPLKRNIRSITMSENTKRYYPYGTLASTVLGFVNDEGVGGTGLESRYNKILSGTPGLDVSAKTARNTEMPFRFNTYHHEAENGKTLLLSIDETIQHYLEKHLETAVVENKVHNRAVGIAMDVNTGEVLAMATKPDFDPNNFKKIYDGSESDDQTIVLDDAEGEKGQSGRETAVQRLQKVALESGGTDTEAYLEAFGAEQNQQWRNKAISDPYEPGSVFKLVTASAALDTGAVGLGDYFDCYGSITVLDTEYGCWKEIGHGNQSFAATIRHSCNPAFVRIGQRLGGEAFYNYFDAFGLTAGTGIDLPGEAASIYHTYDDISNSIISLSSSSFGQTFKITAIQMLTAVCAVVNGGNLVTPHVVKQVIDSNGSVVSAVEPEIRRQVISEETSRTMCEIMESVVADEDGSGRSAYIAGYHLGGKTGTAEKTDKRVEPGEMEEHVLSFVGVAPMDDPQIAVLVVLDTPEVPDIMGSTAAAPVVKYILEDVLPYMGVEPKYTEEEQINRDVPAPNVIGLTTEEAGKLLEEQGFSMKVIGSGETVLKQVPTPSSPVPKDVTLLVYTEDTKPDMVEVPNVIGQGKSNINARISEAGFNLRLTGTTGSGCVAIRQSPEAGTLREVGTVVTVDCVVPSLDGIASTQY